jgi:lysophospholipase L1-like esterase
MDQADTDVAGAINQVVADIDSKWAAIQALVDSSLVFETKAQLDASIPTADANGRYPLAKVWRDVEANNGIYGYYAGAWVKSEYDPVQFATTGFNEIERKIRSSLPIEGDDVLFVIRDKTTKRSPFLIMNDGRGTIKNGHIKEIEYKSTEAQANAATTISQIKAGRLIRESDENVAFAVRDKVTQKSPFAVMRDKLGTIKNGHIEQIEEAASLASRAYTQKGLSTNGIEWAVTFDTLSGNKAVLLGVRLPDGMIINPSFQKIWRAQFGTNLDKKLIAAGCLYVVEGRSFTLYSGPLFADRSRSDSYVFCFQSVGETEMVNSVFRESLKVRASELGSSARLIFKNSLTDNDMVVTFPVVKSSASKTGSPVVIQMGDSLTQGSQDEVAKRFDSTLMTPQFIGSRRYATGGDVIMGEGRGGWTAADFTYEDTRFPPLVAGEEAASLASGQYQKNPFVRLATEADDIEKVRNGYIFDFAYYLTRFEFATPDVITINLGTNDFFIYGISDGLISAINNIGLIVEQIKLAAPSCKIGIGLPQSAHGTSHDTRYLNGYSALFLNIAENYKDDDSVYIINHHMLLSDQFIYPTSIISTDPQTGQTIEALSDGVHFTATEAGVFQYSESVFSFIHAIA